MSLPPTLVIDDRDEDRTQVDARARRSQHGASRSKLSRQSFGVICASIALALFGRWAFRVKAKVF